MKTPRTSGGLLALMVLMTTPASTIAAADVMPGEPVPSPGCRPDTSQAVGSSTLEVAGETRSWRTLVPSAHDGSTPLPLVIWLHGQGMAPRALEESTGLDGFGEEHGIVVVAPQGHAPDNGWMWERDTADVPLSADDRDVAFIDALIDRLGSELCLDLARVYATGYSMGGHGVSVLACALSERIAAVAPSPMFSNQGDECVMERPVPMIAFHQVDDENIVWQGGLGAEMLAEELPWGTLKSQEPFFLRPDWSASVTARAEAIALRNGCRPGPAAESVAPGLDRFVWDCPDGAAVELVSLDGGGHSWELEEGDVRTSELMWQAFERHRLPEMPE